MNGIRRGPTYDKGAREVVFQVLHEGRLVDASIGRLACVELSGEDGLMSGDDMLVEYQVHQELVDRLALEAVYAGRKPLVTKLAIITARKSRR